MKSLTLHNLEEPLLALLKETAKNHKMSINQFAKSLIEKSLGYKKSEQLPYYNDFKDFCGIWSKDELQEFENVTKQFEKIDQEDWK